MSERILYKYKKGTPWGAALGFGCLVALWAVVLWSAVSREQSRSLTLEIAIGGTIAILIFALALSSVTVVVSDREIRWWLGMGFPRGHLPLERLIDAAATHGKFWEGWGSYLTGSGWIPRVRALNAVRLRGPRRRCVVLATDRPQELLDAIARARWTTEAT